MKTLDISQMAVIEGGDCHRAELATSVICAFGFLGPVAVGACVGAAVTTAISCW